MLVVSDKKIEKGLEVQLPVYMLAVKRLLGLEVLGAELRFLEDESTPTAGIYHQEASEILALGRKKKWSHEELETLLSDTEKNIVDAAGRLRKGDISVRSKSCDYCDFESVCRFEKWKLVYAEADNNG